MATSIFIARIFGVFYLVAAVGLMFNRRFYRKFLDDYYKNAALVFFTGMFALITGIVIVLIHNVWVADWTLIITLLGWIALFKGVWIIVLPNTVSVIAQIYHKNDSLLVIHSIVAFIFGIVLTFFGFF